MPPLFQVIWLLLPGWCEANATRLYPQASSLQHRYVRLANIDQQSEQERRRLKRRMVLTYHMEVDALGCLMRLAFVVVLVPSRMPQAGQIQSTTWVEEDSSLLQGSLGTHILKECRC